jgi:hypothetical protein
MFLLDVVSLKFKCRLILRKNLSYPVFAYADFDVGGMTFRSAIHIAVIGVVAEASVYSISGTFPFNIFKQGGHCSNVLGFVYTIIAIV